MKLCIVTNNFPPVLDGVGDYSFQLANEFRRNGHQVTVVCHHKRVIQESAQREDLAGFVAITVPAWNWRAFLPLRRFLSRERPDWLLVQYVPNAFQRWAMPIWLPLVLWLAKRQGLKVSITFHEVYVRMVYWPLKYWFMAIVQRGVCFLLTRIADVLITSIDLYADLLRNHTNKPVHLIPIGSNILPTPVTDQQLLATRQEIAPNDERVISTFGLRSQDLLLQVFEEVVKHQPHTRLLICSKLNISVSQQECYEQLKEKIVVTGFMEGVDVYRYLRASDVYFMPDYVNERGEGGTSNKSTSLATGLVAGLPVVGTRGDMNNTLLLQTPGVFLEDISRPDVIAERLLNLISDSESQSLRTVITKFVEEYLNWSNVYQSYKNIISKKS